jgi:hypothetical protein
VPCLLGDDADAEAILGVGAGEALEAVEPGARVEMVDRDLEREVEAFGLEGLVDLAPPDLGMDGGDVLEELVVGERPVRSPVMQTVAPLLAREPSPARMACSISSAEERLTRKREAARFS